MLPCGILRVWNAKGFFVSLLRRVNGGETARPFSAARNPNAERILRVRCQTVIPAPIFEGRPGLVYVDGESCGVCEFLQNERQREPADSSTANSDFHDHLLLSLRVGRGRAQAASSGPKVFGHGNEHMSWDCPLFAATNVLLYLSKLPFLCSQTCYRKGGIIAGLQRRILAQLTVTSRWYYGLSCLVQEIVLVLGMLAQHCQTLS